MHLGFSARITTTVHFSDVADLEAHEQARSSFSSAWRESRAVAEAMAQIKLR